MDIGGPSGERKANGRRYVFMKGGQPVRCPANKPEGGDDTMREGVTLRPIAAPPSAGARSSRTSSASNSKSKDEMTRNIDAVVTPSSDSAKIMNGLPGTLGNGFQEPAVVGGRSRRAKSVGVDKAKPNTRAYDPHPVPSPKITIRNFGSLEVSSGKATIRKLEPPRKPPSSPPKCRPNQPRSSRKEEVYSLRKPSLKARKKAVVKVGVGKKAIVKKLIVKKKEASRAQKGSASRQKQVKADEAPSQRGSGSRSAKVSAPTKVGALEEPNKPEVQASSGVHVVPSVQSVTKLCDIVWAKLPGYPWWPGIVCLHPTRKVHLERDPITNRITKVHVQFFDDPPTRAWVTFEGYVKPFLGPNEKYAVGTRFKTWSKKLSNALEEACIAITMPVDDRPSLLVYENMEPVSDSSENEGNSGPSKGKPETKRSAKKKSEKPVAENRVSGLVCAGCTGPATNKKAVYGVILCTPCRKCLDEETAIRQSNVCAEAAVCIGAKDDLDSRCDLLSETGATCRACRLSAILSATKRIPFNLFIGLVKRLQNSRIPESLPDGAKWTSDIKAAMRECGEDVSNFPHFARFLAPARSPAMDTKSKARVSVKSERVSSPEPPTPIQVQRTYAGTTKHPPEDPELKVELTSKPPASKISETKVSGQVIKPVAQVGITCPPKPIAEPSPLLSMMPPSTAGVKRSLEPPVKCSSEPPVKRVAGRSAKRPPPDLKPLVHVVPKPVVPVVQVVPKPVAPLAQVALKPLSSVVQLTPKPVAHQVVPKPVAPSPASVSRAQVAENRLVPRLPSGQDPATSFLALFADDTLRKTLLECDERLLRYCFDHIPDEVVESNYPAFVVCIVCLHLISIGKGGGETLRIFNDRYVCSLCATFMAEELRFSQKDLLCAGKKDLIRYACINDDDACHFVGKRKPRCAGCWLLHGVNALKTVPGNFRTYRAMCFRLPPNAVLRCLPTGVRRNRDDQTVEGKHFAHALLPMETGQHDCAVCRGPAGICRWGDARVCTDCKSFFDEEGPKCKASFHILNQPESSIEEIVDMMRSFRYACVNSGSGGPRREPCSLKTPPKTRCEACWVRAGLEAVKEIDFETYVGLASSLPPTHEPRGRLPRRFAWKVTDGGAVAHFACKLVEAIPAEKASVDSVDSECALLDDRKRILKRNIQFAPVVDPMKHRDLCDVCRKTAPSNATSEPSYGEDVASCRLCIACATYLQKMVQDPSTNVVSCIRYKRQAQLQIPGLQISPRSIKDCPITPNVDPRERCSACWLKKIMEHSKDVQLLLFLKLARRLPAGKWPSNLNIVNFRAKNFLALANISPSSLTFATADVASPEPTGLQVVRRQRARSPPVQPPVCQNGFKRDHAYDKSPAVLQTAKRPSRPAQQIVEPQPLPSVTAIQEIVVDLTDSDKETVEVVRPGKGEASPQRPRKPVATQSQNPSPLVRVAGVQDLEAVRQIMKKNSDLNTKLVRRAPEPQRGRVAAKSVPPPVRRAVAHQTPPVGHVVHDLKNKEDTFKKLELQQKAVVRQSLARIRARTKDPRPQMISTLASPVQPASSQPRPGPSVIPVQCVQGVSAQFTSVAVGSAVPLPPPNLNNQPAVFYALPPNVTWTVVQPGTVNTLKTITPRKPAPAEPAKAEPAKVSYLRNVVGYNWQRYDGAQETAVLNQPSDIPGYDGVATAYDALIEDFRSPDETIALEH